MSNFDKAIKIILSEPPELHYPSYYADLLSEADVPNKNIGECSEIPNSSDLRQQAIDLLDEQIAICDRALTNPGISMNDEFAVTVEKRSLIAYREKLECLLSTEPEIIRCKDCKHNPKYEWFGCPMSHLSEAQRPETAWCWKAERRTDG